MLDGLGLGAGLSVGNLETSFVGTKEGGFDGFNDIDGVMEGVSESVGGIEGEILGLGLGAGDSVGKESP
jgi:hypothetical protein